MKHISTDSSAKIAWINLKEVLKAVRDGSDIFPPLKEALVRVTVIMDSIDVRCVPEYIFF
jgi:hypothetical protein